MFAIGALRYPGFGTAQVILNIFIDNSFLLVVAVGMTFVILTGGIDLSVGSVVALGTRALRRRCSRSTAGSPYARHPARAARSAPTLGLAMGCDDPLLRDPAVHRHARRACSSPAGSVTRSPPTRSRSRSRRSSRLGAGHVRASATTSSRRARSSRSSSSRSGSTCCTTRGSAATSTRSAATSSRRC